MIRPRLFLRHGHPDLPLSLEEVLEPAYHALVAKAVAKGASEDEAAVAIESLAQAHIDTLIANAETETEIAQMRREAGLPVATASGPPMQDWMLAVGAMLWCVLLFSGAFLAGLLLLHLLRPE